MANSQHSPLGWHRFNKSASSDPNSEAANGADFALTLLDEEGNAHVAVFQAKRSAVKKKDAGWSVDVRHNVKDASGKPSTQMVALETLGLVLLKLNSDAYNEELRRTGRAVRSKVARYSVADLGWIHYLLYGPGTPVCIPLKDMASALKTERARKGSSNYFYFSPEACPSIMDVLQEGASPKSDKWLSVRTEVFFTGLPACLSLMPVVAVGTSKAWEHVPENRRPPPKKDWRKPKMQRAGKQANAASR